jgi:C1A family cysteine protease
MFAQFLVASTLALSVSGRLFSDDATHQKYMWESFKTEHGRKYDTMDEETSRFEKFLENLKVADSRNDAERKSGGTAVHGITKFSDMSQTEFESNLLTSDFSMRTGSTPVILEAAPSATAGLVDWSGKLTTPVKDQGYCGSCWAFSATEQIESDSIRTLGQTWILSPEQIAQCDSTSYGCNGGWTENAFNYVKKAGGIETESDYPYTSYQGITGTCKSSSSKFVVTVNSYTTLGSESSMATYMQSTGPLSVCLDASSWNSYTGGIMSTCGKSVDHCVQAVGVDASTGGYWKVRNSWGTTWGESGYIRLAYGKNTCNIASDPNYVSVSAK